MVGAEAVNTTHAYANGDNRIMATKTLSKATVEHAREQVSKAIAKDEAKDKAVANKVGDKKAPLAGHSFGDIFAKVRKAEDGGVEMFSDAMKATGAVVETYIGGVREIAAKHGESLYDVQTLIALATEKDWATLGLSIVDKDNNDVPVTNGGMYIQHLTECSPESVAAYREVIRRAAASFAKTAGVKVPVNPAKAKAKTSKGTVRMMFRVPALEGESQGTSITADTPETKARALAALLPAPERGDVGLVLTDKGKALPASGISERLIEATYASIAGDDAAKTVAIVARYCDMLTAYAKKMATIASKARVA